MRQASYVHALRTKCGSPPIGLGYRGFTCRSRITGLTCTNRAGHGLFLSRASYRLF